MFIWQIILNSPRNVAMNYFDSAIRNVILSVYYTRKPSLRWQTRATRKHAKIAPIRRVSFHFTEFHFAKFQITVTW